MSPRFPLCVVSCIILLSCTARAVDYIANNEADLRMAIVEVSGVTEGTVLEVVQSNDGKLDLQVQSLVDDSHHTHVDGLATDVTALQAEHQGLPLLDVRWQVVHRRGATPGQLDPVRNTVAVLVRRERAIAQGYLLAVGQGVLVIILCDGELMFVVGFNGR